MFQEQVMRLAVVAADYTPGEADQLRRDMAAWRRGGRMEQHRARLISRMEEKGIEKQFAERVFEQIRGFGEYGFPESHAASFALITYATAWMRCHYPVEFACGLLNAWPMGFYSPATIVDDAKRRGVETLPIDVTVSEWMCAMEPRVDGGFAVRMGARYLKGMQRRSWLRVVEARGAAPFTSIHDLSHRTGLGEPAMLCLAEAGALRSLEPDRRQAMWEVRRAFGARELPMLAAAPDPEVVFEPLSEADEVGWDYETSIHSTGGHPMEAVRGQLRDSGFHDARSLSSVASGAEVRFAGAVICRQRPGTAKGVTFFTLEDETGFANLIVWKNVFEKFALVLKTEPVLAVRGKVESQQEATHLSVESAWRPRLRWRQVDVASRDFH